MIARGCGVERSMHFIRIKFPHYTSPSDVQSVRASDFRTDPATASTTANNSAGTYITLLERLVCVSQKDQIPPLYFFLYKQNLDRESVLYHMYRLCQAVSLEKKKKDHEEILRLNLNSSGLACL